MRLNLIDMCRIEERVNTQSNFYKKKLVAAKNTIIYEIIAFKFKNTTCLILSKKLRV